MILVTVKTKNKSLIIERKKTKAKILSIILIIILSLSFFACERHDNSEQDDLYLANEAMLKYDISEAEMHYQRYLRKNLSAESRWWVWNKLLDIAINIRQQKKTAADYLEVMLEEYEKDESRSRSIKITLANIYNELRYYDRAVFIWENLVKMDSTPVEDKADLYRSLSSIYLRRLEFTESTNALHACLRLDVNIDDKADCLYDLAETQIILGELPQAEKNLLNLLELPVSNSQRDLLARFLLADVMEQQGRHDEALKEFKAMQALHPNHRVMDLRIQALEKRKKKK